MGDARERDGGARTAGSGAQPGSSLDPLDWVAFRRLLHSVADQVVDYLENVRERPVWRPVPEQVKCELAEPLPQDGTPAERVCDEVVRLILPYATGNIHPRFFGWVHGSGTAGGLLADLFASAMNANVGGRDHGAVYVERRVIEWCRQLFGFPETAGGLLVSGTSMASFIGLTVARNHAAGGDVRAEGIDRSSGRRLSAYISTEAHESALKALELLGLARRCARRIPVDDAYRMRIDALRHAVEQDLDHGYRPFCVVGTAGTVNTGAVDDLASIAALCAEHDIWFHVDGAFGALGALCPALRPLLKGLEQADSLAFDFHKWMHVQYDCGCILIRRGDLHREAFSMRPPYLSGADRGLAAGDPWFCEYGPELSRGFRALKVWFTLKEHGVRALGEAIGRNCQQAQWLAGQVEAHPDLELMAPVALNIVCFRFIGRMEGRDEINRLNHEIVLQLHELGIAAPSTTMLDGTLAIRTCICNHRTTRADLRLLIDSVVSLGRAHSL